MAVQVTEHVPQMKVSLGVVGIEMDRPLIGVQRLVVPLFPDQHVAEVV